MKLATRLTVTMVALVLVTVTAVAWLVQNNLEAAILPVELDRMRTRVQGLAARLDAYVRGTQADVLAVRGSASIDGIIHARGASGVDPRDGTSEAVWRDRLTTLLVAELAAKPSYLQFRLVGAADNGREIVRVDRSGPAGSIRVVPEPELQAKGDLAYFGLTIGLAAGEVYISPIELNEEYGVVEMPHVPVLRAATPVHEADGQPFGILIINVDMRPILAELRSTAEQTARVYVINEQGDYLVHADQTLEFGLAVGQPPRWRSDFPELAGVLQSAESLTHVFHGPLGELLCAATAPLQIAGGPRIVVIETVPYSEIMAPASAVRWSGLLVALGATVCALGVAALLARSLARPLEQMTQAVERFRGEEALGVALGASGEIGILASAFNSMAAQVRQKNAALQQEIAERRRTERVLERRAAELERSNGELQQFAYVASHDLQEPLRSIAGYTRLLAKRYQGKLDQEADEFIAFAIAGAERMQELISDLLVYARVGTRGKPPEPANAGVLVRKVMGGMQAALQQCGAEIVCEDLPTVHVDESQLGQLFQNLISNGLKFRSERPLRIHISAMQKGADWLFSVADNGIGVEKEFLERIFEMFQRLHERDKYEGSGIGLAIARKVVHRHGGRIWAESEVGKGTTFYFTIPAGPPAG